MTSRLEDFTSQELKVLKLSAEGFSCKEMAIKLCISEETVKKHRKNIIKKLGL